MVTRDRQRETENEKEDDWEWSRFVNRPGRPTQNVNIASWQDIIYYPTSIPVEVPVSKQVQTPRIKRKSEKQRNTIAILRKLGHKETQELAHYIQYEGESEPL